MSFSWTGQVKLKAQQSMLQKRLQQALQMHLQPRTSVNTESPADRTLRLLDSLLQVKPSQLGCLRQLGCPDVTCLEIGKIEAFDS